MKYEKNTITCRVCLGSTSPRSAKYLSIFENYNDCFISDKINCIANVEIKKDDGLPDRICPECLLQLENAVAFKLKCESSNVILHSAALTPEDTGLIEIEVKQEDTEKIDWLEEHYTDLNVKQEPEVVIENPVKTDKNLSAVECHDCGGSFKSKCKLRVHWRSIHQPGKLTCPSCKRMFKTYKAFNLHKKKKPRSCTVGGVSRIEGQGRSRIFHCTECAYHTKRLKDMDYHRVIHTGDRRYACDKCPKVFSQLSSLQCHQESVHKIYLLETTCQYCGKHIKGRNRLYRHIKTHTETSVQCEVCKRVLKNKKCLLNHMSRHSGVKAYSCEICAKTFYTLSELCTHRTKVHFKSKSYECDLCGYKMYTAERMKTHRAKHTETNVPCLICGTFLENEEMLMIHQKRHYERNSQCPHCDMKFYNRKSRSKHVRLKHRCTMLVNKPNEPIGKVNIIRIINTSDTGSMRQFDVEALSVSHTEVISNGS